MQQCSVISANLMIGLQQTVIDKAHTTNVKICELVRPSDTDVFNAFFNFWTIYQVGGLQ